MSKNKRIKAILEAFDTEPRPMMFSIVMSSYDNREQVLDILAQLALPQYVNAEFEVILIDSHFENDDGGGMGDSSDLRGFRDGGSQGRPHHREG